MAKDWSHNRPAAKLTPPRLWIVIAEVVVSDDLSETLPINHPILDAPRCWRRWISPELKVVSFEWANFQVMRRTHASLMRELKVDPKVVADQLGHSVDVNLNDYTQTGLGQRTDALNTLESALPIM